MEATLKGFLVRDPEFLYTNSGTGIWKSALVIRGRTQEDQAVFVEVLAFNGTAEALAELALKKGTLVEPQGKLQTETYTAKDGSTKTRIALIVNRAALPVRPKKAEAPAEAEEAEAEAVEDLF